MQFTLSDYIELSSLSFFILAAVLIIITITFPFSASRLLCKLIRGLLYVLLKESIVENADGSVPITEQAAKDAARKGTRFGF